MWERDKPFKNYYDAQDEERKQNLFDQYKRTRNEVITLKRKLNIIKIILKKILKKQMHYGEELDH